MKLTKGLFLAFAGLGLFACSNEDVAENGFTDNGKTQSMVISLNGLAKPGRVAGAAEQAGQATLKNVAIYYADDAGNVGHITTIESTDSEWSDLINPGSGYVEHNLPAAITKVHVVGNYDDTVLGDPNDFGSITTLKAKAVDAANQQVFGSVLLFGEDIDGLDPAEADSEGHTTVKKAELTIRPLVSRLEVSNIQCEDLGNQYSKIELKQIGLMNFYTQTSIGGTIDESSLKTATGVADPSAWDETAFPDWSFDKITGVVVDNTNPWSPTEGVYAYNIIPNKQTTPLEVRLVVAATRGTDTVDPFNNTLIGKLNQDLETGKIYTMDYKFKEENIGPWDPNQTQCVEVTVNVHNWEVVALTPSFE